MRHTQADQEGGHRPSPFSLLQPHTSQLPPDPLVQPLEVRLRAGIAEVRHPSGEERVQFRDHPLQADAPVAACDLSDPILGAFKACRCDGQPTAREQPIAEELAFAHMCYRALRSVHAQPEPLLYEARQRRHHTFPGNLRPYIHVQVVGVPAKPMVPPLQLLVHLIQQEVRKQGG